MPTPLGTPELRVHLNDATEIAKLVKMVNMNNVKI
jgi:hypothetical protein